MAVWMARMFALQQFRLYRAPVYLPMVLHLLVSIWSTINGLMFPDPNVQEFSVKQYAHVNYLELMIRVLSLGGTLMVANTLEKRMLRWAAIAIDCAGGDCIHCILGILPGVQTSNFMAFPQVITMAILAAFALVGPGKVWARTLAGTVALSICSNLFLGATQWVSGWAAAMVGPWRCGLVRAAAVIFDRLRGDRVLCRGTRRLLLSNGVRRQLLCRS
jgi:hypothetical protein